MQLSLLTFTLTLSESVIGYSEAKLISAAVIYKIKIDIFIKIPVTKVDITKFEYK